MSTQIRNNTEGIRYTEDIRRAEDMRRAKGIRYTEDIRHTNNSEGTRYLTDQDIEDLYRKLKIKFDEDKSKNSQRDDLRKGCWPPLPVYSIRICRAEDLDV